jgi:predicted Zn-dependent peptidase
VFDHLHAVAYQGMPPPSKSRPETPFMTYDLCRAGQPLSRTILGPKKNILSIKRDDLASYIKTNYAADRVVLVGAGGFDHGELVKATEKAFGTLPVSLNPNPLGRKAHPKPDFIGLEVRVPDDDIPTTHRCSHRGHQLVLTRLLSIARHAVHLWQLGLCHDRLSLVAFITHI